MNKQVCPTLKCLNEKHAKLNIVFFCMKDKCDQPSRLACSTCILSTHALHLNECVTFEDIFDINEINMFTETYPKDDYSKQYQVLAQQEALISIEQINKVTNLIYILNIQIIAQLKEQLLIKLEDVKKLLIEKVTNFQQKYDNKLKELQKVYQDGYLLSNLQKHIIEFSQKKDHQNIKQKFDEFISDKIKFEKKNQLNTEIQEFKKQFDTVQDQFFFLYYKAFQIKFMIFVVIKLLNISQNQNNALNLIKIKINYLTKFVRLNSHHNGLLIYNQNHKDQSSCRRLSNLLKFKKILIPYFQSKYFENQFNIKVMIHILFQPNVLVSIILHLFYFEPLVMDVRLLHFILNVIIKAQLQQQFKLRTLKRYLEVIHQLVGVNQGVINKNLLIQVLFFLLLIKQSTLSIKIRAIHVIIIQITDLHLEEVMIYIQQMILEQAVIQISAMDIYLLQELMVQMKLKIIQLAHIILKSLNQKFFLYKLNSILEIQSYLGLFIHSPDWLLLQGFIGESNLFLKLVYRATRDGMTALKFHENCDKIGRNIVVIKSKSYNKVFGGYALNNWAGGGVYIVDNSKTAFLFSITHQTKHPIQNIAYAQYNLQGYGPTFGSNHDLHVAGDFKGGSYSNLGSGFNALGQNVQTHLAGAYNYEVLELEVFELQRK